MNADKKVESPAFTLLYRSPELIDSNYLDYSIDYWSFGVCAYLMLTGSYPFEDKEINDIHHIMPDPNEKRLIKDEKNKINKISCDFVSKLLNKNLNERLIIKEEIKIHPFFSKIDWNQLENGKKNPPIKPCHSVIFNCSNPMDTSKIDFKITNKELNHRIIGTRNEEVENQEKYDEFCFNIKLITTKNYFFKKTII